MAWMTFAAPFAVVAAFCAYVGALTGSRILAVWWHRLLKASERKADEWTTKVTAEAVPVFEVEYAEALEVLGLVDQVTERQLAARHRDLSRTLNGIEWMEARINAAAIAIARHKKWRT